jgi:hypothetical protein
MASYYGRCIRMSAYISGACAPFDGFALRLAASVAVHALAGANPCLLTPTAIIDCRATCAMWWSCLAIDIRFGPSQLSARHCAYA